MPNEQIHQQVETYETGHKRRKTRHRILIFLSAVIVFCTTYLLILPALTMVDDDAVICGMVEHKHGEDCYAEQTVIGEGGTETTERVLVCEIPEHEHDMACFPHELIEERTGFYCGHDYEHTHDESCYRDGELICTLTEHTHDESCLVPAQPVALAEENFEAAEPAELPAQGEESAEPVELAAEVLEEITIESEPTTDGAVAVITGAVPEGAEAVIEAVPLSEEELINYFGAEKAASMHGYVAYDICILVDGEKWQPDESVRVTVKHINLDVKRGESLGAAHVEENGTASERPAELTAEGDAVVTAESFSLYIFYTVDFSYEGLTYSIAGESKILLSALFEQLDIPKDAADATEVIFSTPELVAVAQTETEDDWLLTSLAPFDTEETLTITFADGTEITINVTDATQNETVKEGSYNSTKYTINVYTVPVGGTATKRGTLEIKDTTVKTTYELFNTYKTDIDGSPVFAGAYYGTSDTKANSNVISLKRDSSRNLSISYATDARAFNTKTYNASNANALYLTYVTANAGSNPDKIPDHTKQIDWLGDKQNNPDTDIDDSAAAEALTDLYRLYLNIGPETAYASADLLLVLDQSNSMETNVDATGILGGSNITRRQALNGLLNGLGTAGEVNVSTLYTNGLIKRFMMLNPNNRIAVTGFATSPNDIARNTGSAKWDAWMNTLGDTDTVNSITFQYNDVNSGGTNYVAGLQNASQWLNKVFPGGANADSNKKIMIFLSDGEPTFHYEGLTASTKKGAGNETNSETAKYTKQAIDEFKSLYAKEIADGDLMIYCIGMGKTFNDTYLKQLSTMGNPLTSQNFGTLLTQIDDAITGGIGHTTKLKVTDKLSEYVDFVKASGAEAPTAADTDLDLIVKMVPSDKSKESIIVYQNGAVTEAGTGIISAVTINGKDVTLDFVETYEEIGGYTYSLSFNVKLTEKAHTDYTTTYSNSYGGTKGDAKTDYGSNKTSSLKDGFYSNALVDKTEGTGTESAAKMFYTRTLNNASVDHSVCFDHPVVQVHTAEEAPVQPVITEPTHLKKIDYLGDKDTDPNNDTTASGQNLYRLYLDVGPETAYDPADLLLVLDCSSSMWTHSSTNSTDINGTPGLKRLPAMNSMLNGLPESFNYTTNAQGNTNQLYPNGLISKFMTLNPNNRIAITGFDANISTIKIGSSTNTWSGWYTAQTAANQASNPQTATGTNYVAGLKSAVNLLDSAGSDRKKIMVFFSDGEPTRYYTSSNEAAYFDNLDTTNVHDGASNEEIKTYTNKAINQFLAKYDAQIKQGTLTIYSVGIGNFKYDYLNLLSNNKTYACTDAGTDVGTDFNQLMAQIDRAITSGLGHITDLTVTDKLSADAEFADTLDLKVERIAGTEKTTLYDATTPANTTYLKAAPVIDKANKTVTVEFKDDFQLEGGVTYRVSYNVQEAPGVYDKYKNGYPTKGDTGTDFTSVNTSSTQSGFYSNATTRIADPDNPGTNKTVSEAKITYKRTFGNEDPSEIPTETAYYLHPVMQAHQSESVYGPTLPSTGGRGTAQFYALGTAILTTAAYLSVLLLIKRRKETRA